jgi:hypothetical protein
MAREYDPLAIQMPYLLLLEIKSVHYQAACREVGETTYSKVCGYANARMINTIVSVKPLRICPGSCCGSDAFSSFTLEIKRPCYYPARREVGETILRKLRMYECSYDHCHRRQS